jgi:hypothetical protein
MKEIFQLVGETAAHSIWSVADGANLVPILTTIDKTGNSQFLRLAMDDSADAVRYGHEKLTHYDEGNIGAVFVADGFVTLDSGKTDALVVEVRIYNGPVAKCQMVIPYRSANSAKGFAIHRPQVTELENIEQEKFQPLMKAFFEGVEGHQQGGEIWNQYYVDQLDPEDSIAGEADFSTEQWNTMLNAPFLVFFLIAAADGVVETKELRSLAKVLARSAQYQSDLLHRLITNSVAHVPDFIQRLASGDVDYLQELSKVRDIVDGRFSPSEAKGFKIALIALARDIAEASGGIVGFGDKISDEEKMALAAIIVCLQVALDS